MGQSVHSAQTDLLLPSHRLCHNGGLSLSSLSVVSCGIGMGVPQLCPVAVKGKEVRGRSEHGEGVGEQQGLLFSLPSPGRLSTG